MEKIKILDLSIVNGALSLSVPERLESEATVQKLLSLVYGDESQLDPALRREFEITIENLLLEEGDSAVEFVNHLWYTIIDQRRDVKDFVIPMMASLMLSGFNPDYVVENRDEAREVLTAVLTVYGHELKYPKEDVERLVEDGYYSRMVGSRTDAVVETLGDIYGRYGGDSPWRTFKEDVLRRRSRIIREDRLAKSVVRDWPYIRSKSFRFFLRDIEPILADPEAIPVPVDTNVAQCIQKTGLLFEKWPPDPSEVIPVLQRGQKDNERRITRKVKELAQWAREDCGICEICDPIRCHSRRIVYLAQVLFLMGAVYCQRCCTRGKINVIDCPMNDCCMVSLLRGHPHMPRFLAELGEK
ncbi:MAG: hypothetical protein ACOC6G_00230 [Thermoproteota archaeon]